MPEDEIKGHPTLNVSKNGKMQIIKWNRTETGNMVSRINYELFVRTVRNRRVRIVHRE